ncbi:MAG: 23S rRNA (adenine(2503)-C(2))-methyltransferase RlmN [Tissierellia bacterium]|nr:23S rRNA (adenine(2503)-C(2))-methyltransferase RlmN [Tissierellia bacterium]
MREYEYNSINRAELKELMTSLGEKAFRGDQLFEQMHKHRIFDLEEMTVFSKQLKDKLLDYGYVNKPEITRVYESKIDGTKKFLVRLRDGQIIETVFMPYKDRNTLCISSQVGCKMGCTFCASTKAGFVRSLTSAEIVSQIYLIENYLDTNINNIVFMGIGEPLDNFDNVVGAIYILNDKHGKNLSQRSMTLSTSGLADKIYSLAELNLSINLAVSFHYPFDDERSEFMPINKKFNIKDLLEACKYYFDKTSRRVSFEYVLVQGLNDTDDHVNKLVDLFKYKNIHINLIPLNEIKEFNYKSSNQNSIRAFQEKLEKEGINSTIRNKKGADIEGACGQLRVNYIGENL